MKVFVTGATGVMGTSIARALLSAGHDVKGLVRESSLARARSMDFEPFVGDLFDPSSLARGMRGCDVVCNAATHVPVRNGVLRPGAWRVNDRIRSAGSRAVGAAAVETGVSRLVQGSVSFTYADQGGDVITEQSAIEVSHAAEPVLMAESNAQQFAADGREAVVLRFGTMVGNDDMTTWRIERARAGKPIGVGDPYGWQHVIHVDDVGTAFLAALSSPSGFFNAGAEPVMRRDLVDGVARVAGRERGSFYRPLMLKFGGERIEWLARSQRVSSQKLTDRTGWKPLHPVFSTEWLSGDIHV